MLSSRWILYILSIITMVFIVIVYKMEHFSVIPQHNLTMFRASQKYSGFKDAFYRESKCFNNPSVFFNYSKLHHKALAQKHDGKFLIYMCNDACGGYGNRIHAITMSLLFAILSGRIFLIEMTFPFDINRLLHPNAINWNYADYKHITNTKDVNLIDKEFLKEKWPSFSRELFDPKIKVIKFHTNMGFPWYYEVFDDKWSKTFQDWFNITKDNSIYTYGCVLQYLFTYDKAVTIAIEKEMEELDLIPGLYVSVHFRTFKYCEICSHLNPYKYLNCSLNAANQMTDKSNATFKVYLMTDSEEVAKIASTEYRGKILASHVKGIHVDKNNNDLINGFIGVMVNIEVAAKAAVFVKFDGSTLSDLVHSTGKFNKDSVIILS